MNSPLRWGFMGSGWIAQTVAEDLAFTDISIHAIGSSKLAKAEAFAKRFAVPNIHDSWAGLAQDPEVDVVYVNLMNQAHVTGALLAVEAGKHVLVEKPFTMNRREAETLRDAARANNLFAMEAMWSRCLPVRKWIRDKTSSGIIGEVQAVVAQYNENLSDKPRIWELASGGGAIMDLGIYPLSFIIEVLGFPTEVTARSVLAPSGVDNITSVILQYPDSRQGNLLTSVSTSGPSQATILGSEGRIDVLGPVYGQSPLVVRNAEGEVVEQYNETVLGSGRQYQFLEAERCIKSGLKESPLITVEDSVRIMSILDDIRAQVGVRFPVD